MSRIEASSPRASRSLEITHPHLAAQWHPSNTLRPSDVTAGSERKVMWFCPNTCPYGCPHEWEAQIASRCKAKSAECTFCRGTRKCEHGTIHYTHPEIAAQLHPTKNEDPEKIRNLTAGSNDPTIWWICPNKCPEGCIHEWQDMVNARIGGKKGCPYCATANRRTCIHTSIVTTHPEVVRQWHPSKNEGLDPRNFTSGSGISIWWLCPNTCESGCVHEWQSPIACRCDLGAGCHYCTKQKCCIHESIEIKSPDIARLWHPTKNGDLKASMVTPGSHQMVWWLCPTKCSEGCVHEWQAPPKQLQVSKCPYCSVPRKKNCIHGSIVHTHPDVASLWHYTKNKEIDIVNIMSGTNLKVWWLCPNTCAKGCIHEWETTVASLCLGGSRCPYCSSFNKRNLCEHTSVTHTHPLIAKSFHPTKNGDDVASNYSYGSEKTVWWICERGHEYMATFAKRSSGRGCPDCRFKTEAILFEWLVKIAKTVGFTIKRRFRPKWCKNPVTGCSLEFDFKIPELKLILELDGRQHFEQVRNWKCPKEQLRTDVFKMRHANKKGYSVIRLLQEEVWDGREAWLEANLHECIVLNPCVTNTFMATDDGIYDQHIEMLEGDDTTM